jgi:hypothetical protein
MKSIIFLFLAPIFLSNFVTYSSNILVVTQDLYLHHILWEVKVKLSRYRPGQALGGSRSLRLQNF